MTKKKEDLGGVWRTVGGRRIFIKDGQDLYEAMNDSGKFTNLKRTNKAKQGVKEIDYIGQDGKKHKMDSYEYPEDRDGYHKYLTEKYGTYKEEEIKDKYGRTDYKKLREEFYQHQEKTKERTTSQVDKEYELYKRARQDESSIDPMTENSTDWEELDRKYKDRYEKEKSSIKENKKIDDFVKNNPDWEFGRYDEDEFDDLADTLGIDRNNVAEEIYDRIREKSNKSEYLDKRNKEIEFERDKGIYTGARETNPNGSYKYQKEFEQEIAEDRRKFNQIAKTYGYNKLTNEQILRTLDEAEKKGLYHAKSDIDAMKRYLNRTVIEKDTGSAYSKPGKRWEVLEKGKSAFGKDIYKVMDEEGNVQWKDASSFYEKELNSKPKVDKHDLDKLNEIADKYKDVNKYDMDDISKDYIKNRRNEMSFNKRNDEFKANNTVRINNLNQYRKDYFTPGKDDNETKDKIIKTLNDMPAGTELGQNYEENVSGWTSHGGYTSKHQRVLAYKKNEDGSWEGPYGKKDVNDMALSVIHNGTDIKTLEQAKADKEKLSINDRTEHRDIVNIGKDSAGNDVGKSTFRTTYNRQIVKDDRYYAWVDEVDPNSELTESELEQMYRSIYPNRIKK